MDKSALHTFSYGLYVVSASAGPDRAACLVNTGLQLTSNPMSMMVCVNKENVTADVIKRARAFTVTVVDETADMLYMGNFGFRTSANYDKFEKFDVKQSAVGSPYVEDHTCAVLACKLVNTVDVGTHYIFVGEIEDAQRTSDNAPMTYEYYHTTLKGKTPPKASAYTGE